MIKISIRDLNPHIVCSLCAGYFINATTINECLHTFCKSCLILFLQTSKSCPQCGVRIHETQPHQHLKADHVLQDIVFKLLPDLRQQEEERIDEFYQSRGIPRELQKDDDDKVQKLTIVSNSIDPTAHFYSNDDQIIYSIQPYSREPDINSHVDCQVYQSSVRTCLHHIKKMLANQINANIIKNKDPLNFIDNIIEMEIEQAAKIVQTQSAKNDLIQVAKIEPVRTTKITTESDNRINQDQSSKIDSVQTTKMETVNTDKTNPTQTGNDIILSLADDKSEKDFDNKSILFCQYDSNTKLELTDQDTKLNIDSNTSCSLNRYDDNMGVDIPSIKFNPGIVKVDCIQIIIGKNILLKDNCSLHFAKIIYDNMIGVKTSRLVLYYRLKAS